MKFEEWWESLTASEQKLIGRTNAKFVWMEACEACAKLCEDDAWRCKKIAVETQNKKANAAAIEASLCAAAIRARGNQ